MSKLSNKLTSMFSEFGVEVFTPGCCEMVELPFHSLVTAVLHGQLSDAKKKSFRHHDEKRKCVYDYVS